MPKDKTILLFSRGDHMLPVRYERHLLTNSHLPFIFHTDTVVRTKGVYSNWHDNTEFLFCISGSGIAHSDNTDLYLKPGNTVIINPRCLHYITSNENVTYRCLIIDNSFFDENGFDLSCIRFESFITDPKAGQLMEKINAVYSESSSSFRIAEIRLAVLNYIIYICKNYIKAVPADTGGKISKSHEAILKAVEFIDSNYEKHLTIDEISAVAGFSKYHFSRLFKNYTGFTVIEHINGRRCENAKIMLENPSKPISLIAAECGFDSCSYFAKAFEKSFGMLPSSYRKSILKR